MKSKIMLLMILCSFGLLNGCKAQGDLLDLSVTIAQTQHTTCKIFTSQQKLSEFRVIPNEKDFDKGYFTYSDPKWFTDTSLLATEVTHHPDFLYSNLVIINSKGEVIERLTDNQKHNFSNAGQPSQSRRKILYTSSFNPPPPDPIHHTKEDLYKRLNPDEIINILDYQTKEVLNITNFTKGGLLSYEESPWSPDEEKLVYTVRRQPLVTLMREELKATDTAVVGGSYIYDLSQMKDVKFIPGSYRASWSPAANVIAYLKNSNIWLYEVDTDKHALFQSSTDKFKIEHIRWVPDGEYLYLQGYTEKKRVEKLYRVSDSKEIPFVKPNIDSRFFSWR